jgi:putative FmdB family regulatory protein
MPLFEYRCTKCNTKFEVLHKSSIKQEEVICPGCHSTDVKKLLSNFSSAVHNSHLREKAAATETAGLIIMDNVPPGYAGWSREEE